MAETGEREEDRDDYGNLYRYLTQTLGPAGLILLGGLILVLFPEPVTSAIGILVVVVGIVAWVFEEIL